MVERIISFASNDQSVSEESIVTQMSGTSPNLTKHRGKTGIVDPSE